MNKLLKLLKSLLAQGFATKADKAAVRKMVDDLEDEEKDVVKDDVEKVDGLPEEKEGASDDEITKQLKILLGGVKDEAIAAVQDQVKSWITEQKDLMAKRAGVYAPEVDKDGRKRMNKWTREFMRALVGGNTDKILKELSTDATGSPYGGYVVDSELSAEIRHLITEYGVARREMMAIQLSKHSYKANDLVTDVTVYWVDEESAIQSTQVVLGQETLELKKIGAIVTLTSELIEDEEIDLASFIATRVAEGFAKKEDLAFFDGDGTSTYGSFTGLLRNSSVNEVTMAGTTFASMDADDLLDMIDATPSGALANGKFYLHRTIMSIVRKLKDDQNQYLYQRPSEAGPGNVWGYPVVMVEAMPAKTATAANKSFVLFGDLKKACIFGYKGAIKANMFNAGIVRNVANNGDINLITSDRQAIRWTERCGYVAILPTAVTKLTTAAASA